jgi:anthranilate/para-aminobenzoate synthase component II
MHGLAVECTPKEPHDPLFVGLPVSFEVGLYHSWAADPVTFPKDLRITAWSEQRVIMAVRHRNHAVCGVQFHPESVLTPMGGAIIANWLK